MPMENQENANEQNDQQTETNDSIVLEQKQKFNDTQPPNHPHTTRK